MFFQQKSQQTMSIPLYVKYGGKQQRILSTYIIATFLVLASQLFYQPFDMYSRMTNAIELEESMDDQYQVPICFITSQFSSSPKKMDKLINVTEKVPYLASSPAVRFFAFSNLPDVEAPGWTIIVKDFGTQYNRFITQSRWPKFQGFKEPLIEKNCKVVFYVDGNIVPIGSFESFQQEAKRILVSDVQLSQYKHPDNPNPEREFSRIVKFKKDFPENTRASIQWLHSQPDYTSKCQMYENSKFGYHIHSKAFQQVANFFWDRYSQEQDSWRDQPLWCYSLHHFNIRPLDIPSDLFRFELSRSGMGGHKYSGSTNENVNIHAKRMERAKAGQFKVLCTSTEDRMSWGSYQLRCIDFQTWAKQCASNVEITTGLSMAEALAHPETVDYDATVVTKDVLGSTAKPPPEQFGEVFVDLVDHYGIPYSRVPTDQTIIFQTERQKKMYPRRSFAVVEHWYNSYPADMAKRDDEEPDGIPVIVGGNTSTTSVRMATVWNTAENIKHGGCPNVTGISDVSYDCINQAFEIENWYLDIDKSPTAKQDMNRIMCDPQLGRGMLYYQLFRKYDVLVALAKNFDKKLRYGNVQRIVSQMRSGVPVLVEVRGEVMEDFMNQYHYKCAFQHPAFASNATAVQYWTFEEAVEHMKDPELRRECQRHGLEIVKDYSPSRIGQKFLRTLGYKGSFEC